MEVKNGSMTFESPLAREWVSCLNNALDYTSHVLENMKYVGMMLADNDSLLKKDFIAEKEFRAISNTGDIVLLRTPTVGNQFQRLLTRGRYGFLFHSFFS